MKKIGSFFFLDSKKSYNTNVHKTNLNIQLNLVKCFFILKIVVMLDLILAKEMIDKDLLLIQLVPII